ncbi:UDP-N-acetylmuramoyl-L-alanine--D-glutamate ligase [Candidatus Parcubacteria bacterium]|nr:MAG: UDP-N-acetylmuramoyl-L-alanine--D-glutamate ligase [Candidatus Parcubacteria bacterium]
MILKEFYKNKKVLVMGLGICGGGAAVASWFSKNGAKVTVADLKSKRQLSESMMKLKGLPIKFIFGKHKRRDFVGYDLVVQNPAVPNDSKFLKIARSSGAQIENEATLFFKLHNPKKIIAVTGTRGKSTVSTLIQKILCQKYKNILLAGNIAKLPMLEAVEKINKNEMVILELSSWHLERLQASRVSPFLAVITNLMPDHLNRYSTLNRYYQAKKNIMQYQDSSDFAILNKDCALLANLEKKYDSKKIWFSKNKMIQDGIYFHNGNFFWQQNKKSSKIVSIKVLRLKGSHNIENAMAALAVAKILNLNNSQIARGLKSFSGLGGRLEVVQKENGITFVNDTTSTTPEAAIAALKTFPPKRVILIAGGSDKKLKFQNLAYEIKKSCKRVILFKGEGSIKIRKSLLRVGYKRIIGNVATMRRALSYARQAAVEGDIVLLSPACASFGLFANEFDRGRQFKKILTRK